MATGAHVVEEQILDWRNHVERVVSFKVSIADFYVVNAAMIVGAIAGAMIGWRLPEASLIIPALMAINGLFFHIGASIITRSLSPGTLTSVLLYLPIAAWAYYAAYLDGVLTLRAGLISALGGAAVMAYPILLQRLKSLSGTQSNGDSKPREHP